MNVNKNGVTFISDDDEQYLMEGENERGIFNFSFNAGGFNELLQEAIKNSPMFYETDLCKYLISVHCGKENIGFHCNNEFRSNQKTCICPTCGNKVSLT